MLEFPLSSEIWENARKFKIKQLRLHLNGVVVFFVRLQIKVENITVETSILNGSKLLECPPSSEIWENARKFKIKQLILRLNR